VTIEYGVALLKWKNQEGEMYYSVHFSTPEKIHEMILNSSLEHECLYQEVRTFTDEEDAFGVLSDLVREELFRLGLVESQVVGLFPPSGRQGLLM